MGRVTVNTQAIRAKTKCAPQHSALTNQLPIEFPIAFVHHQRRLTSPEDFRPNDSNHEIGPDADARTAAAMAERTHWIGNSS